MTDDKAIFNLRLGTVTEQDFNTLLGCENDIGLAIAIDISCRQGLHAPRRFENRLLTKHAITGVEGNAQCEFKIGTRDDVKLVVSIHIG